MPYTLYSIVNWINGKTYIGQTIETPASRWSKHRYCARTNKGGCVKLRNAMRKHGLEAFDYFVLQVVDTVEEADRLEAKLIEQHDTIARGYNVTPGGGAETARAASAIAVKQMRTDPVRRARQSEIARGIWKHRDHKAHRERMIARNQSVPPELRKVYAARSHAALTPEQRSERAKRAWASMTPEARAARCANLRAHRV